MLPFMVFFVVTLILGALFRDCLETPRSYRTLLFGSLEVLLILLLHQSALWLRSPFAWPQILFWILVAASGLLGNFATYRLLGLQTPVLLRDGVYGPIRHPIYTAMMILSLAAVTLRVTVFSVFLFAVECALLYYTARLEEDENVETFGTRYHDYIAATRMFIPGLI